MTNERELFDINLRLTYIHTQAHKHTIVHAKHYPELSGGVVQSTQSRAAGEGEKGLVPKEREYTKHTQIHSV